MDSTRTHSIFYDTETTGRTDFKAPWNAPHQPNLIQLGYQVYNDQRELVKEVDTIVDTSQFEGFQLEQGAVDVHGITLERIHNEGKNPVVVCQELINDLNTAHTSIAHNSQFDMMVLQCFAFRCGFSPMIFEGIKDRCTMKITTPILKIKGKYGNKWPSLMEAYCNLVDIKGFVGAHDALIDVRACRDIFWALQDRELLPNV